MRGAKSGLADQESRPEAEAAGELVGFGIDDAADLERRIADIDAIAELQVEPRQQRLIGRRAECAVALGEQIGDRHIRLERELAQHRIGAVDRLDLDQRQMAIGGARHAAQRGDRRDLAARAQEGDFLGLGLALEQREATSPPSSVRPSRANPSLRLAATEPTPEIVMTPSAMQAMKT